jgi:hypothetical protein
LHRHSGTAFPAIAQATIDLLPCILSHLPQVADANTPLPLDVAGECSLYDGFMIADCQFAHWGNSNTRQDTTIARGEKMIRKLKSIRMIRSTSNRRNWGILVRNPAFMTFRKFNSSTSLPPVQSQKASVPGPENPNQPPKENIRKE